MAATRRRPGMGKRATAWRPSRTPSRQAAAPSGTNVEQGDFWYETDTETLHVYREVSSGVFDWVPILLSTSDSDTIDGGSY